MSTVVASPKIVLAHLKRRTTLCHRRALVLTTFNQESDRASPAFLKQFKEAAEALEGAAQMEYEFATLQMLAQACADPAERKGYETVLVDASARIFKALLDGETFTHLGIPGKP